jgi:hypothetical protein
MDQPDPEDCTFTFWWCVLLYFLWIFACNPMNLLFCLYQSIQTLHPVHAAQSHHCRLIFSQMNHPLGYAGLALTTIIVCIIITKSVGIDTGGLGKALHGILTEPP